MRHEDNDTDSLDAALRSWQAPAPSPWFKTRAAQHISRAATAGRAAAWPMAPLKLASAGLAAAVVGIALGFAAPNEQSFALEETAEEMVVAMDTVIGEAVSLDGAEMIDVMW